MLTTYISECTADDDLLIAAASDRSAVLYEALAESKFFVADHSK